MKLGIKTLTGLALGLGLLASSVKANEPGTGGVQLNAGATVDACLISPSCEVVAAPDASSAVALLGLGLGAIEFVRRRK